MGLLNGLKEHVEITTLPLVLADVKDFAGRMRCRRASHHHGRLRWVVVVGITINVLGCQLGRIEFGDPTKSLRINPIEHQLLGS
jgi:hypothetical protein